MSTARRCGGSLRWRGRALAPLDCCVVLLVVALGMSSCAPPEAIGSPERGSGDATPARGGVTAVALSDERPLDRDTVGRALGGLVQVTSPGPFRHDDVAEDYRDCDGGMRGALSWLSGAADLVGEEVATDAVEPGAVAGTIGLVARMPRPLEDPLGELAEAARTCDAAVERFAIDGGDGAAPAVWLEVGGSEPLDGWVVATASGADVAVVLVATVPTAGDHHASAGVPSLTATRLLRTGLDQARQILGRS